MIAKYWYLFIFISGRGKGSRGRRLSGVQVSSGTEVLSLLWTQEVSDSAVLTSAGRSFHHSGAKTEKS